MDTQETALKLNHISFSYNKKKISQAICDFNLEVKKGSFTTLLGESGCGKTTLLRLISGFLTPDEGFIEIDGINQNKIAPDKRHIGMVFQDYALFPHLTVKQNILYGIKNKNDNQTIQKLTQISQTLNLEGLLQRFPNELSGGQQQRVALARSLILNPKILLMDEPLSSLDTKLREKVREELKEIQKKLEITTIYVTHDREEALSLSDSIAVMQDGKIVQSGTPEELYFKPKNSFTADFVGHANFLYINGKKYLIRPEWFSFEKNQNSAEETFRGKIKEMTFLGEKNRCRVELDDGNVITVDLNTLSCMNLKSENYINLKILNKWEICD